MKECLECGFFGSDSSFKEGCPICGNWDGWKIQDAPSEKEEGNCWGNEVESDIDLLRQDKE